MSNDKVYLTKEALTNFKREHELLTEVRRPQAVEKVAATRVLGDLTESSDYTQAKQDLAFMDGRIAELEEVFAKAVLIDEGHHGCQQVNLGCKVILEAHKAKHIFHLVGEWEADPENKKISHESPLGQALLGKKVGDKVEVDAPAGKIVYTVLQIE